MNQLIWRIKEALSKLVTLAIIGAIAFGGYSLYQKGAFRGGISRTAKVALRSIPYFGSRFRHFIASPKSSRHAISYSRHSKKGKWKNARRYSRRRHHRR